MGAVRFLEFCAGQWPQRKLHRDQHSVPHFRVPERKDTGTNATLHMPQTEME